MINWNPTKDGKYSLKSAYDSLIQAPINIIGHYGDLYGNGRVWNRLKPFYG